MFPKTGEVDIIEGVHDNEHNQVTFHTAPGINDLFFHIAAHIGHRVLA